MLTGRVGIEDDSSLCSVVRRIELEEKVRMAFAAPIFFFKTISIIFGGAGLIFVGTREDQYQHFRTLPIDWEGLSGDGIRVF
jgi:hypothetical protein